MLVLRCDDCGTDIAIQSDELFGNGGVCLWMGSIKTASIKRGVDCYFDRYKKDTRHLCKTCRHKADRAAEFATKAATTAGERAYLQCCGEQTTGDEPWP